MSDFKKKVIGAESGTAFTGGSSTRQRKRLSKNPRMGLAVRNLDCINEEKLKDHLAVAEEFLQCPEFRHKQILNGVED